jgi:molybdopterin-guanine dinucleotide biosynthesis protein A
MTEPVGGVLLAGGKGRRMGGVDKAAQPLAGAWLIEHAICRIRPQVQPLILNINDPAPDYADFGLPIVADAIGDFAGPLAGILTGMEWMRAHAPTVRFMASFAVDAPFLPLDLVHRMLRAALHEGAALACATSGGRTHPVFGLWTVALADDLRRAMETEDMRKIDRFTARYSLVEVDFPTDPVDPFFNVNSREDLAEAERLLG